VVVLGAIMSILDITVVSVALETFQNEFSATSAQVAWTMTGYTPALASVIPLTGWADDRFGTNRLHLLAVVLSPPARCSARSPTASRRSSPSASCRASVAACRCRSA
jgi:MFS family permease